MSDTWNELQSFRNKQSSLREKLARRKKEREQTVASIVGDPASSSGSAGASASATGTDSDAPASPAPSSPAPPAPKQDVKLSPDKLAAVERKLLLTLDDVTLELPVNASKLTKYVSESEITPIPLSVVEDLLEKFAAQDLIHTKIDEYASAGNSKFVVESVVHTKLTAVTKEMQSEVVETTEQGNKRKLLEGEEDEKYEKALAKHPKREDLHKGDDAVESLLSMVTAKEKETKKVNDEIQQLLSAATAKELSIVEKFKSQGGASVREFCPYGTKEECKKINPAETPCDKMHFKKIIHKHTDESLGDCSFLNTCFHIDVCKYVHYEIEYPEVTLKKDNQLAVKGKQEGATVLFPAQWVQCDLRNFDMSVLGKFAVVMADPPWDIHMELPYGTMSDDEMRKLSVPLLQDDGYIFLWVTGRAMELGRECLKLWGYERCDELIWVKTNQLQRIIRTGRTGHWLNHGKEHCLVGVKGNPQNMNRGLDCDVIVAEVRATSHKPDEIYGIIERLAPGGRKIELFGRPHNVQPNWITLGNQTDGVKLLDPDVVKAFQAKYPDPKMAIMPKEKHPEMLEAWNRKQREEGRLN